MDRWRVRERIGEVRKRTDVPLQDPPLSCYRTPPILYDEGRPLGHPNHWRRLT
jgi:hypothetical protein